MLRLKAAASPVEAFTEATFQPVMDEVDEAINADDVTTVMLCSGRIYWDLVAERRRREAANVAIVRVERLSPIPVDAIRGAIAGYPNAARVLWVQDEPANQGPWPHMALNLTPRLEGHRLERICRPASSSPAVGSHAVHERQQKALLAAAFESGSTD